jgi:FlaA1/EpsC-like NDP-sugar epimerase
MCFIRILLRDFVSLSIKKNRKSRENIAIYGAGSAGFLLARNLQEEGTYKIICFLDDSPNLRNRGINGIPILSPDNIDSMSDEIEKVFLAIPSPSKTKVKEILKKMNSLKIPIFQIPSIKDITNRDKKYGSLRPIELEDLLGRERVDPDPDLLEKGIREKIIFISGAGGSIGKELAKQVLKLDPKMIIFFDISEASLYELSLEIQQLNNLNIPIVTVLGDICDKKLVENIFNKYSIDVVFHAAAYKHVPIVENNRISGLYNNIYSTLVLCELSKKFNVGKFVLISTDKAVRPTNVMGLSKRIAELIVQNQSNKPKNTCFSMVRFGNVLGSSGSVVPLFKKQIAEGGPITLTDPKVIRYFMSISEAAQLVIQTSELARGGEVFLLDMGDPVFIKDLAYQMVMLSGASVKDKNNIKGDIEIKEIGLRQGEKLYEELLIDSESISTSHPLIFRAIEKKLDEDFFNFRLDKLISSLNKKDLDEALILAKELVPEWIRSEN